MTPDLFNQLARSLRSTFPDQFDRERKVDDVIIKEILTNATWAPDHGKEEPWHFTIICNDGVTKFA
ncbi:MAG: nitroreductase family protein, partial [Chitinophagaceae bacterium]|nr:nitroreductase family protein [Chitinophagaceae bacterium]